MKLYDSQLSQMFVASRYATDESVELKFLRLHSGKSGVSYCEVEYMILTEGHFYYVDDRYFYEP